MYGIYLPRTRFRRSFTVIYRCKQTNHIGPSWCKLQVGWQPVQWAVMCNRIHLVHNKEDGCYPCHFDLKLTRYSSGLPTAFRYLLPQDFSLCFIIIISWLSQQQIMAPQPPQQGEGGTESSRKTAMSSDTPPAETQLQRRHHIVHRDAANAAPDNVTLDALLTVVRKTGSRKNTKQHAIRCKCNRIGVDSRQLMI